MSEIQSPIRLNLNDLRCGSNYKAIIILENSDGSPFDLTDCTIKSSVRHYTNFSVLFDFDIIVENPSTGYFSLNKMGSFTQTLDIPSNNPEYTYNVLITTTDGSTQEYVQGYLNILPTITNG